MADLTEAKLTYAIKVNTYPIMALLNGVYRSEDKVIVEHLQRARSLKYAILLSTINVKFNVT